MSEKFSAVNGRQPGPVSAFRKEKQPGGRGFAGGRFWGRISTPGLGLRTGPPENLQRVRFPQATTT